MRNNVITHNVSLNGQTATLYSNPVKYWDAANEKYLAFAGKRGTCIYLTATDLESMMGSPVDAWRAYSLITSIDDSNRICTWDKHAHTRRAVTSVTELRQIAGLQDAARSTWARLYKKIAAAHIVRERKQKINRRVVTHYYVNPCFVTRTKWLPLDLYDLFRDELQTFLCARALDDLDRYLMAKRGTPLFDDDDTTPPTSSPVIIPERLPEAPATMTTGEKLAIFNEYVLGGHPMQMYQLRHNGMYATASPDMSANLWHTPNTIPADQFRNGRKKAKGAEVTAFNSWFIDIDAGKDAAGKYLPLDAVAERKAKMRAVIATLPEPSAVVETRNGYHIYFACYGITNREDWQAIEDKLIDRIKIADPCARDISRLLRVPYSIHNKDPKAPYMCNLIAAARVQYPAADLNSLLDTKADDIAAACRAYESAYGATRKNTVHNTCNKPRTTAAPVDKPTNAAIEAVKRLQLPPSYNGSLSIPNPVPDLIPYIKANARIGTLLDLPYNTALRCIYDDHPDRHPSATIYRNANNDRYVCSCNQGHADDVINVVCRLAHCDTSTAIDYLATYLNIYRPAPVRKPPELSAALIDKTPFDMSPLIQL